MTSKEMADWTASFVVRRLLMPPAILWVALASRWDLLKDQARFAAMGIDPHAIDDELLCRYSVVNTIRLASAVARFHAWTLRARLRVLKWSRGSR